MPAFTSPVYELSSSTMTLPEHTLHPALSAPFPAIISIFPPIAFLLALPYAYLAKRILTFRRQYKTPHDVLVSQQAQLTLDTKI